MDGFSRSDGVCVECDSNPWIMIGFILLGAVVAAVCYYFVVVMLKINVGVILTVFYLLYVQLTKKAMDIFNCAAADPPDDPSNPTTYMSIAPDQECWRPGTWETGMHVKLMPWAIVFVICYSLAFPMFIFFKFQKNKMEIFEDKLLAAKDRGEKSEYNVN
jgi:hypothetical protein